MHYLLKHLDGLLSLLFDFNHHTLVHLSSNSTLLQHLAQSTIISRVCHKLETNKCHHLRPHNNLYQTKSRTTITATTHSFPHHLQSWNSQILATKWKENLLKTPQCPKVSRSLSTIVISQCWKFLHITILKHLQSLNAIIHRPH
jgi:hypothetical protein